MCKRFKSENFTNKNSETKTGGNYDEVYVTNEIEKNKIVEKEKNIPLEKNEKINQAMKIVSEDHYHSAKQKKKEEEQIINPDIKYDNYFDERNNDLNKVIYVNPIKNRISNKKPNIEKKLIPDEKPITKSNFIISRCFIKIKFRGK